MSSFLARPLVRGILWSVLALPCVAGGEAGMVKTSQGAVVLDRNGEKLAAPPGTRVQVNDRLRTGPDGRVGLVLQDNTILTAGPNALVVLDRFAFDPATHQGALEASVKRGTLAVISGKLAKSAPENVQFRTPTSILGVRGTEFVIDAGSGEE